MDEPHAVAAVAVVGWFVPPPGIPLAAFGVVDVASGEVAYRRGRRTYGGRGIVK
ncbi:hypothetical protein [Streptomyces sp. NPDC001068]|uniref:hypothetical protein n=1 Tax=Streptomyces sp. NPDC001068 TaxID=3364544 RepID=UPI0036D07C57